MNVSHSTGRIETIVRLRSSDSGNPRFRITLEFVGLGTFSQSWNTAADHSFCYAVGNRGLREGDTVTIAVGGRGTIVDMTAAASS